MKELYEINKLKTYNNYGLIKEHLLSISTCLLLSIRNDYIEYNRYMRKLLCRYTYVNLFLQYCRFFICNIFKHNIYEIDRVHI